MSEITVPPTQGPSKDEKTFAMFCHLSALAGFIIPFGNVIGPLILWQMKKAESAFIDDQGKEALNFQITIIIAALICLALIFVLIGAFLLPLVGIVSLIFTVIGAIKANEGVTYRYPFAIRLVK
ncbi:MAG TPA: DUF4870 domain-containing protein [Opitutaceae bacterium]|nr:DUF4870 domain-containing protein [Opitutaceae bacterium]